VGEGEEEMAAAVFGSEEARGRGPVSQGRESGLARSGQGTTARREARTGTRRRREVGEGAPDGWAPRVSERGREGGGGRAADGRFGPISASG
jgi:hypothetical protein